MEQEGHRHFMPKSFSIKSLILLYLCVYLLFVFYLDPERTFKVTSINEFN